MELIDKQLRFVVTTQRVYILPQNKAFLPEKCERIQIRDHFEGKNNAVMW